MSADRRRMIELSTFRAAVARLYAAVLAEPDAETAWDRWRHDRDELFRTHPQSPFAGQPGWTSSAFFPYDPTWRVLGTVVDRPGGAPIMVEQTDGVPERFDQIGAVRFERQGSVFELPLYWTDGYSGGLFLPFGDETNGNDTFGSGRYLLDQAKSAILGFEEDQIILDFNFAYHPSCVWGDWVCPLPRAESRLDVRVEAGEMAPKG